MNGIESVEMTVGGASRRSPETTGKCGCGAWPSALRAVGLVVILVLTGGRSFGDDSLRAAQRELRARKLYFGPIDGRESVVCTEAIRRLQALKGIDQSGQLDGDTRRALGMQNGAPDARADKACAFVQQYLAARMGNDLDAEMGLFAETIDYFEDGMVARAFIRSAHQRENERWPRRRYTLLNRVATANLERLGETIVTARIRTEVGGGAAKPRVLTEDIVFTLRETRGILRMISLKRVE